jgi:hypothetical protein
VGKDKGGEVGKAHTRKGSLHFLPTFTRWGAHEGHKIRNDIIRLNF